MMTVRLGALGVHTTVASELPALADARTAVRAQDEQERWLTTITNEAARAWWKDYVGARTATYNPVQDATTQWMIKTEPDMTEAEASIIAATVCCGIDRDGDGEITFSEFAKFSEAHGQEYTVAKLREFEVERKEEDHDEEKMQEYAQYLGIDPKTEENILWIAKKCMHAPLPKGWKEFTDDGGNSYFHHDAKDETSWDHPLDSHFKQLVADTRKRMAAGADAGAEPPSAGTPEPNVPADDADPM